MKKLALLVFIVVALAVPATAAANNGYSNIAGIGGSSGGSTPVAAATEAEAVSVGAASTGATLPFTGFEAGLMAGVGVLLVGGGLLLRRFRPQGARLP